MAGERKLLMWLSLSKEKKQITVKNTFSKLLAQQFYIMKPSLKQSVTWELLGKQRKEKL